MDAGLDPDGLTRRQVIGAGVAVTMTVVLGVHAGSSRAMASSSAPLSYLRRSSYAGLAGSSFGVRAGDGRATALTLVAVGDVAGARGQRSLRDHEDVFVLELDGPVDSALPQGTYDIGHDELGSTALFVVPVGPVAGGRQSYEVVVDRSVGAEHPPRPAEPPPAAEPGSEPSPEPGDGPREALQTPAAQDPAPAPQDPARAGQRPAPAPGESERAPRGPAPRRRRRGRRPRARRHRPPRRQQPAGRRRSLRRSSTLRS